MNSKILLTSLALIATVSCSSQLFAMGSCQITSGPIPELAGYQRSVETRISALITAGKATCGATPVMINGIRTIEVIDRAFAQIPIFSNTFLDFLYNIQTLTSGNAKSAVFRDGAIFTQIEQQIATGISSVTSSCNLDDATQAGFMALLQENRTLENIYKQAALGTPSEPTGLSDANSAVAVAINRGYTPLATEACESTQGKSFDEVIIKLTQTIEFNGKSNEGLWDDWKKAIALFQGGSDKKTIEEYTNIQRKLLQDELARQGFSPRMAQTILSNFDCTKSKAKDDSTIETIRARTQCFSNPIIGIENILLPWRQRVDIAKTTDERVNRVYELSSQQKVLTDITRTYANISSKQTPAIDSKSALMSNLIDLHLSLLFTADAVEKRIPMMYANCMRAQRSVPCPKP